MALTPGLDSVVSNRLAGGPPEFVTRTSTRPKSLARRFDPGLDVGLAGDVRDATGRTSRP